MHLLLYIFHIYIYYYIYIYYHMSSYFVGGGAADRLSGLEWRYIKELFESAAGKVQRTSMSFSWNLGLAKNCFKTGLELDLFCTRARELFVSHEKNDHVFTSCCFRTYWSTDLRLHSLLSSWITQSSQNTNLLNACCPVIIGCVCWIQLRQSASAFN